MTIPDIFKEGTRVLLLLHRAKDGGHNKEFKRRVYYEITHNKEQWERAIERMLVLKENDTRDLRIYSSVNSRSIKKAEYHFKKTMLESDLAGGINKEKFWERLPTKWVSALMKNSTKTTSYFLLDIDSDNANDTFHKVITFLNFEQIDIIYYYETKNGYHIITQPFNPNILNIENVDIKKDDMLLVAW